MQRLSFNATGTPASGPGSSPDATMAVDSLGVGHGPLGRYDVEAVQVAFEFGDTLERALKDRSGH